MIRVFRDGEKLGKGDILIKLIKIIKIIMLDKDKRYFYNKTVAICNDDLEYIKSLKINKFGKKSLAGILSFIIKEYKNKN